MTAPLQVGDVKVTPVGTVWLGETPDATYLIIPIPGERLSDDQVDRPRTGPDDPAADGGITALAAAQPAGEAAARPPAGAPVAAPDRETGPDDRGGDAPIPGGAATAGDRAVAVAHWDEDDERALREELGLLDLEDQLDALFARADAEGVDPGDLAGIDEVPW